MAQLTYSRAVFDAPDEDAARRIILTPEFGQGTDERWERETPYLAELTGAELRVQRHGLIIDYGCGLGRLAKTLIERFDCRVLGVDISDRMRGLAPHYVKSQNFSVVSPHVLHSMVANGLRADGALSVWVLQHCLTPAIDIDLVASALKPAAGFFVVNLQGRAVPTEEGRWANDGVDVQALLSERFTRRSVGQLDPTIVPPQTRDMTFWATYER
jgi:SAM-dependent methyltransferase